MSVVIKVIMHFGHVGFTDELNASRHFLSNLNASGRHPHIELTTKVLTRTTSLLTVSEQIKATADSF